MSDSTKDINEQNKNKLIKHKVHGKPKKVTLFWSFGVYWIVCFDFSS